MPVPTINFDTEYRFTDGKTRLNAVEFTRRFLSFHQRLVAMEQITYTFEGLATEIGNLGIERVNALILPLIEAAQTQLDEISTTVTDATDLLEQLQASGIDAVNVDLAAIEGLAAGNLQAAITEILAFATDKAAEATAAANRVSARGYFMGAM